jgi:hypothetical protein
MKKYLVAMVLMLIVAIVVPTASTQARPLKQKYTDLYYAVKKKQGKNAPGRNIRKYGVRTKHGVRKATPHELAKSIHVLRNLLIPYLVARKPGIPPSGALTAKAGYPLSAIAACESGGNPSTNTGNGFYGKYQFTLSTWQSVGGSGNPAQASEAEQDRRAAMLYAREGASPWPVCGR